MELLKNTLTYQRLAASQVTHGEENAESIVPDTLPDMERIIDVTGMVFIREREVRTNEVQIKGQIRATVLYTSQGGNRLHKIDVSVPFSHNAEIKGATPRAEALCSGRILSADARALNPRKVAVHVVTSFTTKLYESAEDEFTSGIIGAEECCMKTKRAVCALTCAVASKNFSLVEDIELDSSSADVATVLRGEMAIRVLDAKAMANKAVIKAQADVAALCEDREHGTSTLRHRFTFTQIADIPGADEGYDVNVSFALRSLELDVSHDMAAKGLALSAGVMMNVDIVKSQEIDVMADMYSLRREAMPVIDDITIIETQIPVSRRVQADEFIDIGVPVKRVIDYRAQCEDSVDWAQGETSATAGVMVTVIYESEDGELYGVTRRIPVKLDVSGMAAQRFCVALEDCDVSLRQGGFHVSASVNVCSEAENMVKVSMVTDIVWGEAYESDPKNRLSAIIRRASASEDTWDIAKEYRTTTEAIEAVNKMESGRPLQSGELLLIPMNR